MRLPDLREEIARCRRHGQTHDVCMVRYVDLDSQNRIWSVSAERKWPVTLGSLPAKEGSRPSWGWPLAAEEAKRIRIEVARFVC